MSTSDEIKSLIIEAYGKEAKEKLALLREEVQKAKPSFTVIRELAHTLKGSAAAADMHNAERAALHLENFAAANQFASGPRATKQARMLVDRVGYWCSPKVIMRLARTKPNAIVWSRDPRQNMLYKSLVSNKGYAAHSSDDLATLDQLMSASVPASLLLIIESSQEYLSSIFAIMQEDLNWSKSTVILFSSSNSLYPADMDIVWIEEEIAPGVLMDALERIDPVDLSPT